MERMDGVTVRRATVADIPLLLRYRRAMAFDMGTTDAAALDAMIAAVEPYLQEAMPTGRWHAWIAEPGGCGAVEIVQWIPGATDPTPLRAWMHNIFIEPEHRRRGIGRLLTQTMIAWCREQGFRSVYLHASDQGRPLYTALGFTAATEMRLVLK